MDFFKSQKVKKGSARFAASIKQGEIGAALAFFDERLAAFGTDVSKPVRAIYHLQRWLEKHEDSDYQALAMLASDTSDPELTRAVHIVRRLRREISLAEALRLRNPAVISSTSESPDCVESRDMEKVALSILETYKLEPNGDVVKKVATATLVERSLPDGNNLPPETRQVRNLLLLWSRWTLSKFSEILVDPILSDLINSYGARLGTIYGKGFYELLGGQILAAMQTLAEMRSILTPEQGIAVVLGWGLGAINAGKHRAAIQWFLQREIRETLQASPATHQAHVVALSLAYFQDGKFSDGRQILQQLSAPGAVSDQVRSVALFLHAASLLNEAQSWSSPGDEPNPKASNHRMLNNRTLWGGLRQDALAIAEEIGTMQAGQAWRGHLLIGLLAYIDKNVPLNAHDLEQFSAAAEHLESEEERVRLKVIEGVLVTRSKATEEAVGYIERKEYANLRKLYEEVLLPLGDAIPAKVLAAVYLSFAENEPDYDPVPDLQRIPRSPDNEAILDECIQQIRGKFGLQGLARKLKRSLSLSESDFLPLTNLAAFALAAKIGALSRSVFYLTQSEWQPALNNLPALEEADPPDIAEMIRFVQFYAGWRLGKLEACSSAGGSKYLGRGAAWQPALSVRLILEALDHRRDEQALSLFIRTISRPTPEAVVRRTTGFTLWQFEKNLPRPALDLISLVENHLISQAAGKPAEIKRLVLTLALLKGLASAKMEQHTTCIDSFSMILSQAGPKEDQDVFFGMVRLFRLQAELAMLAGSVDIKTRLPSGRRSLSIQAAQLKGSRLLEAYGYLVEGLVTYLASDNLVSDEIINNLANARQTLGLKKNARFLEKIISQLNWRKQVITEFWASLQQGNFKLARSIFGEISPVFGDNIPHTIRLGMVLVDWDSNTFTIPELLQRMAALEEEAPEISPDLIKQVKNYIVEGDRILHYTNLIKEKDFDAVIEFVEKSSDWSQEMPTPVAIGLLYALYKKKRTEQALSFADPIRKNPNLPDWVRNDGFFILGYLLYDNKDYQAAAESFEKVSLKEMFGHNTDRYWAVSHFSHGLQLLEAGQKQKAFDAFRRSLNQRGGKQENVQLAPLFLHFGLQNLEERNGNRALQAFSLLADSLEGLPTARADVAKNRLLTQMGKILCESLIEQDVTKLPSGERFSRLADEAQHSEPISAEERYLLERSLRILAITQEIRREHTLPRQKSKSKLDLRKYLETQIKALENIKLPAEQESAADRLANYRRTDPVLMAIKGLLELWFTQPVDLNKALNLLTEALRLGAQSQKLGELVQSEREKQKKGTAQREEFLNLFDQYLIGSAIPEHLRANLIRSDNIAEMYRMSRSYTPRDLGEFKVESSIMTMKKRIENLKIMLKDNPKAATKIKELELLVNQLTENEAKALSDEQALLILLSETIYSQKII